MVGHFTSHLSVRIFCDTGMDHSANYNWSNFFSFRLRCLSITSSILTWCPSVVERLHYRWGGMG